jgi:hypothetical protein
MTGGEDAWFEPDSEGCLLVVGGYSYRADLIREVVQQVSKRILALPSLSDFIDVKFVDLGTPPDPGIVPAEAVGRLVRELSRHGGFAARNYFALVIVDRSATAARQVLLACPGDELIAKLPVNYLGIANVDDRGRAERKADIQSALSLVIAPDGTWDKSDLITELQRHADHLMRDFATSTEKGITTGRFDDLRPEDYGEEPSAEPAVREPEPETRLAAIPPVLPVQSAPPDPDGGGLTPAGRDEPSAGPDRRVIPRLPWRPGPLGRASRRNPVTPPQPASGQVGAVYLVLSSNEVTGEQADRRRGRSVLLALDDRLAAIPHVAYQVRAAQVTTDVTRDNLRPAGQLSRRGLKQHSERTDLARVLGGIDRAMTRDLAAFQQTGAKISKPAVVIFAADAPLADLATIEALENLARKADIRWVAPEKVLTLLSPRFAQLCGADPIPYHEAVADEVIANLLPAPAPAPGPDPPPAGAEESATEAC